MEKSANVQSQLTDYETVLETAFNEDNVELFKTIVDYDAKIVNAIICNLPLSSYVCLNPCPNILSYLIYNKFYEQEDNILSLVLEVFVNDIDLTEEEALKYKAIAQILFDNGIYFDYYGNYDWGFLYLEGEDSILGIDLDAHLKELVEVHSIDLNAPIQDGSVQDGYGVSPFLEACFYSGPKLISAMLNNGAKFDDNLEGDLNPLVMAIVNHKIDTIELLIQKGYDLSKAEGHDLLGLAVSKKDLIIFNYLIEKGLSIHDSEAFTICCESGSVDIMETMLEMGFNPNGVLPNGRLPLQVAIMHNNEGIIKLLIQYGVDIYSNIGKGSSPFKEALNRQNASFFIILKSMLNLQNNKRNTTKETTVFSIDHFKIHN